MDNINQARYLHFLSIRTGVLNGGEHDAVSSFNDHQDALLQYSMNKRGKEIITEAKYAPKKVNTTFNQGLSEKNQLLAAIQNNEDEQFLKKLSQKDEWESQKEYFISKYEEKKNHLTETFAEESFDRDRTTSKILKKKSRAETLEEMSKSLLMGVNDLNFLENDLPDIMF